MNNNIIVIFLSPSPNYNSCVLIKITVLTFLMPQKIFGFYFLTKDHSKDSQPIIIFKFCFLCESSFFLIILMIHLFVNHFVYQNRHFFIYKLFFIYICNIINCVMAIIFINIIVIIVHNSNKLTKSSHM